MKTRIPAIFFLGALAFVHCGGEKVPKPYRPNHAHGVYLQSLKDVGLDSTALGRDWIAASEAALANPLVISPPYEERVYIDSTDAFAVGYEFTVRRGRRLEIELTLEGGRPPRIFMDLFRIPADSTLSLWRVASANETETRLEFEPTRDHRYVVRIQPELLRGGLARIRIRRVPSLGFPVPGKDSTSILSFFGDPRDGGRRKHHGVDIFASRHTPVIAPSAGMVRRATQTEIGGNVVWLWDSRRALYLYFAHLQTNRVKDRDRVSPGDTLGTVGNTGNARTTPPHLHFAVYAPGAGPVDPWLYITRTDTTPSRMSVDLSRIGGWARLNNESIVQIVAAAGERYRIRHSDGRFSSVRESQLKVANRPSPLDMYEFEMN